MTKFLSILKINFKTSTGLLDHLSSKNTTKANLLKLFVLLCFLPFLREIYKLTGSLYDSFSAINQEGLILLFGFSGIAMMVFSFGIIYCLSSMYFSNDLNMMIPLPISGSQLVLSKFIIMLVYEYFVAFLLAGPVIISFGIHSSQGALFYILGLIVFLLLPVMPLAIASIISMLLMRFSTFAKNKDRFKFISSIFGLIFAIGVNFFASRFLEEDPSKLINLIQEGSNSIVSNTKLFLPTAKYATETLINISSTEWISHFAIFLLLNLISVVIFVFIASKIYLKGALNMGTTSSSRKTLSSIEISKSSRKNSKYYSYFKKEIKSIFRTPIYFMNCVIINFIWPIFLLFPMFSSNNELSMGEITKFVNSQSNSYIVLLIIFGAVAATSSFNPTAPTSISREGKTMFINKFLPINYKMQLLIKALSGLFMNFISTLVMGAVLIYAVKIPLTLLILGSFLGLLAALFVNLSGVIVDVLRPKLNWDNEQRAVKQNLNVVIALLPPLVVIGAVVVMSFKMSFNYHELIAFITGSMLVSNIIAYKLLSTIGVKAYSKI